METAGYREAWSLVASILRGSDDDDDDADNIGLLEHKLNYVCYDTFSKDKHMH